MSGWWNLQTTFMVNARGFAYRILTSVVLASAVYVTHFEPSYFLLAVVVQSILGK
jgi:hypothetical protein